MQEHLEEHLETEMKQEMKQEVIPEATEQNKISENKNENISSQEKKENEVEELGKTQTKKSSFEKGTLVKSKTLGYNADLIEAVLEDGTYTKEEAKQKIEAYLNGNVAKGGK